MFQLHHDRLQIKDKLGEGRFGAIFPYQRHPRDLKWVVKKVYAKNSHALLASLPEVILGMSIDHPNIVPIKGYFIEKSSEQEGGYNIYTKLPRMKRTLLTDFKERQGEKNSYSEEEIIRYFYSLVCGIEYLHKKKIYHGEIKLEKLLLDEKKILKIGDIGMPKLSQINYQNENSKNLDRDHHKKKKDMLIKADIWSLGIVILELCCFDFRKVNQSLATSQFQSILSEVFESLKGKYHPGVIELLERILSVDSRKRPSIALIKSELEKNFFVTLIKDEDKRQELNEKISDEQRQEIFGKYEAEIIHLKGVISQFETELMKKSEQKSHAKITTTGGEEIEEETKVNNFQEELEKLREEKKIFAEKEKNLKKHIERAANEKIQVFLTEKAKFQEDIASLKTQLEKSEVFVSTKKGSSGKDYEMNLQKVVSQLKSKWDKWYSATLFKFKTNGKILKITGPERSITDEILSKLSRDLLVALEENNLLNLHGLEFICPSSPELTDKSVADFASVLGNTSLQLQRLDIYFSRCGGLTDKSVHYLSKAISVQAPHLKHLQLFFSASTGVTDKALKSLSTAISNPSLRLQHLEFSFSDVPAITDAGFESVAKAVGIYHQNVQFFKLSFVNCSVTSEKKREVLKKFERVPSVYIV